MRPLPLARRAALLERLAGYVERRLPLTHAMEAVSEELSPRRRAAVLGACQGAGEGAALADVLERSGLLDPQAQRLLKACPTPVGLRLAADDMSGRAMVWAALREALFAPYLRLLTVLGLGCVALIAFAAFGDFLGVGFPRYQGFSREPLTEPVLVIVAIVFLSIFLTRLLFQVGRRPFRIMAEAMPVMGWLLEREAAATYVGALGTSLASGDDLPAALGQAREALGDRPLAGRVGDLERRAADGASLTLCCDEATFLPPTLRYLISEAALRPDLPTELTTLARAERESLRAEILAGAPLVAGMCDLVAGSPVLAMAVVMLVFLDRGFL